MIGALDLYAALDTSPLSTLLRLVLDAEEAQRARIRDREVSGADARAELPTAPPDSLS